MTSFDRVFVALFGFVVLFASVAEAAIPPLERAVAAKLIAEANQIRENEVTVGPMQTAERKVADSTTVTGGICVTFIAPKIENGGRRRIVQTRTFFYDEEWGWYLFATEVIRGGEAIDVVSQFKGRMQLR